MMKEERHTRLQKDRWGYEPAGGRVFVSHSGRQSSAEGGPELGLLSPSLVHLIYHYSVQMARTGEQTA